MKTRLMDGGRTPERATKFTFKLTKDDKTRLTATAAKRGLSASEWIRECVAAQLAEDLATEAAGNE